MSGQALDGLKSYQRLIVKTPWPALNEKWKVISLLLDAIMQKWTEEQAEAVFYWLKADNQKEIAEKLEIKQPAVHQRLQLSGHFAIKEVLAQFEEDIRKNKEQGL